MPTEDKQMEAVELLQAIIEGAAQKMEPQEDPCELGCLPYTHRKDQKMNNQELHDYWAAETMKVHRHDYIPSGCIEMRQIDFASAAYFQLDLTLQELNRKTNKDWYYEYASRNRRPIVSYGKWELELIFLAPENVPEGDDYRAWRVRRIPSQSWRSWMPALIFRDEFGDEYPAVILHSKMSAQTLKIVARELEVCYEDALRDHLD